jgi:hypothetical protein
MAAHGGLPFFSPCVLTIAFEQCSWSFHYTGWSRGISKNDDYSISRSIDVISAISCGYPINILIYIYNIMYLNRCLYSLTI